MPMVGEDVFDLGEERDGARLGTMLERIARAFDVDGEKPRFQQDVADLNGEILLMTDLVLEGAAEFMSKPSRFGVRPVASRGAAAIILHALQSFAPSGGRGHRTSIRGGGPLTTLVVPQADEDPRPLWDLLAANVPTTDPQGWLAEGSRAAVAIFPWLGSTITSEESKAPTVSQEDPRLHPLQALFGMPRRIVLVFEPNVDRQACMITGAIDDVVATGFRMRHGGVNYGVWDHPLTPYRRFKADRLPMHPPEGRVTFQDWVTFSVGSDKREIEPARCVAAARQRGVSTAGIFAAGFVTDNAKVVHWKSDVVPSLPAGRDGQVVAAAAARLADAAAVVARQTRGSVGAALTRRFKDATAKTQVVASVVDDVMRRLEPAFRSRLNAADAADILAAPGEEKVSQDRVPPVPWLQELQRVGLAVFDRHVPMTDLSILQADDIERRVKARDSLLWCLLGYGASGKALFEALGLPSPVTKDKATKDNASKVKPSRDGTTTPSGSSKGIGKGRDA